MLYVKFGRQNMAGCTVRVPKHTRTDFKQYSYCATYGLLATAEGVAPLPKLSPFGGGADGMTPLLRPRAPCLRYRAA